MNIFQKFDTVANAEAGATLHFTLPDSSELAYVDEEKKKPLTVTMVGSASAAHKAFGVKQLRKLREQPTKKSDDKGISDNFFEETAEQQVERLVSVVTGWENMDVDGKGGLDCTPENVKKVFSQYEELRVQAINFLDKRANFTKS